MGKKTRIHYINRVRLEKPMVCENSGCRAYFFSNSEMVTNGEGWVCPECGVFNKWRGRED